MSDDTPTVTDVARLAVQHGFCVVPPREDGTKAPDSHAWKQFQTRHPTLEELRGWYAPPRHGVGLVCGEISGGLELFEFEALAVEQGLDAKWAEMLRDSGEDELCDLLLSGYTERSAAGGLHILYRCPFTKTEKLASSAEHKTLIETKGEGGYVIVAPSAGPVHPLGGAWTALSGTLATVPTITPEQRTTIHRIARLLDQTTVDITDGWRSAPSRTDHGPSAFDLYRNDLNINTLTVEMLEAHGWKRCGQSGDTVYLTRPGKEGGVSATVGHVGPGVTTIFTTSTSLEARTYSPADLFTHVEHGGNYGEAARALEKRGWIARIDRMTPVVQAPDVPLHTDRPEPAEDDELLPTGWEAIDLLPYWRGEQPEMPPTIFARDDGLGLVYSGKVNTFQGESESMKTWAAMCAVAEQLNQGNACIYIDYEDSPNSVVERFKLLGVRPTAPLIYLRPDTPFSLEARDQLDDLLRTLDPVAIVVLDGVTEAMTHDGLNLLDNQDIAKWFKSLPKWVAKHETGPCVITIDHVPKNPDGRGKGAIGGQHKRAGVDGAILTFSVTTEPLARGRDGRAHIKIDKDRPGFLRSKQTDNGTIGHLSIRHDDGELVWSVEMPTDSNAHDDDDGNETSEREYLEAMVLDQLKHPVKTLTNGGGWSLRQLHVSLREMGIRHSNESLKTALETLRYRGEAVTEDGGRGRVVWKATKPSTYGL